MKKNVFTLISLLALAVSLAFNFSETKEVARVQTIDNYMIFIKSEPIAEYEKVGYIDSPKIVKSTDLNGMLKTITAKAKKDFPNADALIFNNPTGNGMSQCLAIKFKK